MHEAMKAGRLTCRELVDSYLDRIHAFDKNGPAINSIVLINPAVQSEATSRTAAMSAYRIYRTSALCTAYTFQQTLRRRDCGLPTARWRLQNI